MAKPKPMYIIALSGQGDTYVKVVDKTTYDWIVGPVGTESNSKGEWKDTLCPQVQLDLMRSAPMITSGSWENDRALSCESTDGYEQYSSITAAVKAIKKKRHKLAGDYEGFIY